MYVIKRWSNEAAQAGFSFIESAFLRKQHLLLHYSKFRLLLSHQVHHRANCICLCCVWSQMMCLITNDVKRLASVYGFYLPWCQTSYHTTPKSLGNLSSVHEAKVWRIQARQSTHRSKHKLNFIYATINQKEMQQDAMTQLLIYCCVILLWSIMEDGGLCSSPRLLLYHVPVSFVVCCALLLGMYSIDASSDDRANWWRTVRRAHSRF